MIPIRQEGISSCSELLCSNVCKEEEYGEAEETVEKGMSDISTFIVTKLTQFINHKIEKEDLTL
jgi:hypothetical protein